MNKELLAKPKHKKEAYKKEVEVRTGNLAGTQRHCPSMQG